MNFCHDGIVPVGEHVGLDGDFLADDALHRIAAPVDLGPDRFDNGAGRCFLSRA